MRARQADEDEFTPLCQDPLAKRLVAIQIVTQQGRAPRREWPAPALQPARAGSELAVLFRLAVLRRDEFRRQGETAFCPGATITGVRAVW